MLKKKHLAGIIAIILIVVPGLAVFYTYTESQKKPDFDVSKPNPLSDMVRVYVKNNGSKDAHSVEVVIQARHSDSDWQNLFHTKTLEILRAGASQNVNVEALSGIRPLNYDEFKVIVSCEEGITREFYFGGD